MTASMIKIRNVFAASLAVIFGSVIAQTQAEPSPDIKLYTLDCGAIDMLDMAGFADDGSLNGQQITLADPCYLIRHPEGDFLWDTGLEQSLADVEGGITYQVHATAMQSKLTDQLATLGLAPTDIDYMAFSHWHPDHSGNAALFADSTFIAHEAEHAFIFSDAVRSDAETFALFAPLENAKTTLFSGTHDVFGDGTAVIHSAPGHTVGHSVLELNLPQAGTLLFTGDLYVYGAGRAARSVPTFAASKTDLLRSMDQFEALAKAKGARVVIQHDLDDFKSLPRFPAYLK
ncbi:N-acyl homoserine lactonase family protein [Kordiimonas aquimaris]|uniref:N-acyl homoserine lactonase family protein n=1 Tax=Kordiimonas aquimaris TaxID=707591 RepID=UPI0021D3310A|nr:N-acyl homoserine lactonase family protein [Kordiimonas aquimaris]